MKKSKWEEFKGLLREWSPQTWGWRLRNLENLLDDPIDNFKHWLDGRKVFGWTIHLPGWLMHRGDNKNN